MKRRTAVWLGGVLVVVGIAGLWGQGLFLGAAKAPGTMMGGPSGSMGSSSVTSAAQLATTVRQGEQGAIINRRTDTVTYRGPTALIVALASPHGKPNMTWEIDGLVNPTIVLPPGTEVTVDLVNTDWGYRHGFMVTTSPPPYPYMAMMGLPTQFLLMPLPERTTQVLATARYYTRQGHFRASRGIYYYLCPVPGHAARGMYGKIVVG